MYLVTDIKPGPRSGPIAQGRLRDGQFSYGSHHGGTSWLWLLCTTARVQHPSTTIRSHLISWVDLLHSSDFCQGAFVGHNDIRAAAVIHQRNAVNQKGKLSCLNGEGWLLK